MTFEQFADEVRANGLEPRKCSENHWQIRGGKYCVNFYPCTQRGPTFYVNATTSGVRPSRKKNVTIADAIQAAFNPLFRHNSRKASRKRSYKGIRNRLLQADPRCFWCSKGLDKKTATMDHMIPLSKGGTNGVDNFVLACETCNQDRKNKLPSRTPWQGKKTQETS